MGNAMCGAVRLFCKSKENPEGPRCAEFVRNTRMPIIWFLGGPRSGKTMMIQRIWERYHLLPIKPGDLIRNEVTNNTDIGKEILRMNIQDDSLIPRATVNELIRQEICRHPFVTRGFVLDGYPKTLEEALDFELLSARVSLVLVIDVPPDKLRQRLDNKYGADRTRHPMAIGLLYDQLDQFTNHITPIVLHYRDRLALIDGDRPEEEVWENIMDAIDELLSKLEIGYPTRLE